MNRTYTRDGLLKNKQSVLERKVDDLERRLQSKIEITSGFTDTELQIRKLQQAFKFFDKNHSGFIDYQSFFSALTNLNFIGVQHEIEGLFNRFDDNATGYINYIELSRQIFGLGNRVTLDVNTRELVENIKARIVDKSGPHGIYTITKTLSRYVSEEDEAKFVDRSDIEHILGEYSNSTLPAFQKFLDDLDPYNSGKISAAEVLRVLKTGMSLEHDLVSYYNPAFHPSVKNQRFTYQQAKDHFVSSFNPNTYDNISFPDFLDYYKSFSFAIEDDNEFEYIIRNSFNIPENVNSQSDEY
eukprot:gene20734-26884_t